MIVRMGDNHFKMWILLHNVNVTYTPVSIMSIPHC